MTLLGSSELDVDIAGIDVCRNRDLDIAAGDVVAILGANGIGKTTLLHTLAGLRAPSAGHVILDTLPLSGYAPRERARRLGVLFQDHQDPLYASVLQTVLAGRHPFLPAFRPESETDLEIAHDALRRTGMLDKRDMPVSVLSGGERKRVALASLLAQRPLVCLLDEPNTHLDLHHQISLLELVTDQVIQGGGCAVMVLHDVNLALRFCRSALLLFGDGDTLYGSTDDVIDSANLTRLYQHPMRAFTDGDSRCFVPG
ncbi:MAG: ABC transporter ATP-binding protein [Proteobacteria bacterium]|nr:MAG: ABC transporter ATP-binding protein [Pseudomonadota bacterium]